MAQKGFVHHLILLSYYNILNVFVDLYEKCELIDINNLKMYRKKLFKRKHNIL